MGNFKKYGHHLIVTNFLDGNQIFSIIKKVKHATCFLKVFNESFPKIYDNLLWQLKTLVTISKIVTIGWQPKIFDYHTLSNFGCPLMAIENF
jgi:hypothetical protein